MMNRKFYLILFSSLLFIGNLLAQENTSALCSNGIDDDGDGTVDCEDSDCECIECLETPQIYTGGINSHWEVSETLFEEPFEVPLLNFPLPNDPSISWTQPSIIDQCSSEWVDPQTLSYPINQAQWVSHPENQNCQGSLLNTYYFYKTTFSLPCSCGENPITTASSYSITVDAYADNEIVAVYVNNILQNIPGLPGGNFMEDGYVQIELNASWLPLNNSITFLIRNDAWPSHPNPEGFLCTLSKDADSDNDGVNDYLDLCLCESRSIVDTNFIFNATNNPLDTGTIINTFLTDYGCDSTVVVKTTYQPSNPTIDLADEDRRKFIPNIFSPNFDGVNDYFTIYADTNILEIQYLRIFDRWGVLVFEKLNFEPNNPLIGWDGTFKGEGLGSGLYTYVAEVRWADGKKESLKGGVTIIK